MCYSAQIIEGYRSFVRAWGATISLHEFARVFIERIDSPRTKVPKAMEALFAAPVAEAERELKALIDRFDAEEAVRLEQELFKQRRRLADAERALATKTTKAAAESRRIAADKVKLCLGKLADLRRTEPAERDWRFYPGWYAPVMVMEEGRRVVKPMRYQCRPAGLPASCDNRYPGTYNARRDNLEGFWKDVFGHTHGVLAVSRFYENVSRDGKNVVLEFHPRGGAQMLVACLWSRWVGADGTVLLSFAAITDDPPPEVAAAGHDRCIVPIKAEHVDAWLDSRSSDLRSMYAILDDRERPYYEHRLAA